MIIHVSDVPNIIYHPGISTNLPPKFAIRTYKHYRSVVGAVTSRHDTHAVNQRVVTFIELSLPP